MDIAGIKQQVITELDTMSGEQKEAHSLAVDVVMDALHRLGYRLLPAIIRMDGSAIADFERKVSGWCNQGQIVCPNVKCGRRMIYQIESQDVNGASVIQSLTADGWTIIPPQ